MTERLREIIFWGGGLAIVSSLLYGGTNHIANGYSDKAQMYFDWELEIEVVPWMILVYISFYPILGLGFFACRDRETIKSYCYSMILSSFIAAVVFLVFPSELGYSRTEDVGVFKPLYDWLYMMDKPVNMYPSLHITSSMIATYFISDSIKKAWVRVGVWTWFVAIGFSVILVHQHHLFDVVTGLMLGLFVRRVV